MNAIHHLRRRPGAMARRWLDAGARQLHLVDLNGAFAGKPVNEAAIKPSCAEVATDPGAARRRHPRPRHHRALPRRRHLSYVIIGTAAVKNPGFLNDACSAFGGHIIVGLDARTARWPPTAGASSPATRWSTWPKVRDYGVEGVIYTDIGRDGMLTGINIEATVKLAQALTIPVIASGGLANGRHRKAVRGRGGRRHRRRDLRPRASTSGALDFADEPGHPRPAGAAGPDPDRLTCSPKRIIPAWTSPAGASSRASTSSAARRRRSGGDRRPLQRPGRRRTDLLDITATSDGRDLILHIIEAVASQVFIPLTVGGGVRRSRRARLLNAGADKVSFNSAAVANPQVIRDAFGRLYGAQCIVVAIDAKRRSGDEASAHGRLGRVHARRPQERGPGRRRLGAKMVEGAGEILTSMDRDGTRIGFDLELTRAVSDAVATCR